MHLFYNHHDHLFPELFTSFKTETLYPLNNHSPLSYTPAPGNHHSTFCLYGFCLFYVSHIFGILQYLSFCYRLISPSRMSSKFIPATACVRVSLFFFFLRLNNIPVYSSHPLWGLRGLVSWWRWLGCAWHPTPDRTSGKSHGLRAPTCQTAASHSVGPFSLLSTPAPLGSPRETSAPLSSHREGLLGWEVPLGVPWTLSEAKRVVFL